MIAKLLHEDHISWVGTRTDIFALDEPYQGFDHVAISIHAVEYGQWQNGGTTIVGCRADASVEADSVEALYQTYEVLTFPEALARIGYQEGIP